MAKWYLINPLNGGILGPCDSQLECEEQRLLLEYPNEWILVRTTE